MAEFGEQWIRERVEEAKATLTDGKFTFEDVKVLIKLATEAAELTKLSGSEKKALALQVAETVLAETDIPVLPDKFTVPFLGDIGGDALIMRFLPGLIDLVVEAARGRLGLARDEEKDT